MALVGRSPIKVTAAPSTAPQEAMAASLQAHIDELVQKNRTCEHTIRKLQQALADEKERGIEAVSRMKTELQEEREEWHEGCDSLLASHRIVHIRTRIELEKERLNVQLEKEENRRERINILHRDYRLTLFQAKESELEAKIGALEDALEDLSEEHEQDAMEYTEKIRVLEKDLLKAQRGRENINSRLKTRETELASLQSEVSTLQKENATLKNISESTSVKLERTELQLEGVKTNLGELESANSELKRSNADLKRQLDRWQSLETKGGNEMEEMRKRKIELEVQVKELQGRVKELEKAEKQNAKALEKEQNKVEKLKRENDRMAELTEDAQTIAKKAQDEYDEAAKQLRAAQRLVEKLQSGKMSKDQVRKSKKPTNEIPAANAGPASLDPSEREVETTLNPEPKARVRPRPAFRGKAADDAQEPADEQEEAEPSQQAKSRAQANSRGKGQPSEVVEASAEEEDEAAERSDEAQVRKKDGKSNAVRKRRNKAPDRPENDDASEETAEKKSSKANRGKGKEKAVELLSDSEDEPRIKRKGKGGKRSEFDQNDADAQRPKGARGQNSKDDIETNAVVQASSQSKARKPSSSQGPRIKVVDNTDETEAQPKKKKKRLFPPSQAETFPWDVLPKGEGFAGLNIPTQLSPVKETDAVPARSVFGKMGSSLGFR